MVKRVGNDLEGEATCFLMKSWLHVEELTQDLGPKKKQGSKVVENEIMPWDNDNDWELE